jgi:hypothetical protein
VTFASSFFENASLNAKEKWVTGTGGKEALLVSLSWSGLMGAAVTWVDSTHRSVNCTPLQCVCMSSLVIFYINIKHSNSNIPDITASGHMIVISITKLFKHCISLR